MGETSRSSHGTHASRRPAYSLLPETESAPSHSLRIQATCGRTNCRSARQTALRGRCRGLQFSCIQLSTWRQYASLRILLPRLQETLLEDPISRRIREGQGRVPGLRQQERRAALVCLYRHHVEKERVNVRPVHLCASTSFPSVPSGSMASPATTTW